MSKESRTQIIRLVAALAIALSILVPIIDSAAEKKAASEATSAASAATEVVEAQGGRSPGKNDMANLMAAMHGAASQQPDDAPKDKYGNPYIIGDLGGVPVNLPSSIVRLVEYDDSPGWDMDKVRTYDPPVRNYQSKIAAFGFTFRNRDALLLDRDNPEVYQSYESSRSNRDNDWISVSISSGSNYGGVENLYGKLLQDNLSEEDPAYNYIATNEVFHGLEVYRNPHINPENNIPWRETSLADDIYIARDAAGNVRTYIYCATVDDVPTPPCAHSFEFPPPMKLRLRMGYNRRILEQWQSIEDNAVKLIYSFSAEKTERE